LCYSTDPYPSGAFAFTALNEYGGSYASRYDSLQVYSWILSRYPLRNVRIFRLPVCYDWFGQEAKAASKLELGRRWSAQKLFKNKSGVNCAMVGEWH